MIPPNTGDTDIDIWVLIESLAYVPRNRHDETATFNLVELRAAITKKLESAYQQGYDDRTLEADHEIEDMETAHAKKLNEARIDELRRVPKDEDYFTAIKVHPYIEARIKALQATKEKLRSK